MPKNTDIAKQSKRNDTLERIQNSIIVLRGRQVLLDYQLAAMYGVETRTLNQAVKRDCKDWRKQNNQINNIN